MDLFGTFVFAISGALVGSRKQMDLLGMFVLASATAIGGGTLRSILIGDYPVPFLKDWSYLLIIAVATVSVFFMKTIYEKMEKPIVIFDALGLGVFVGLGIAISLDKGLTSWAALIMGIISGSFGGVIRDVLGNEIPLIFQREIYATACLIGGLVFLLLKYFLNIPEDLNIALSGLIVFIVRMISVKLDLSLPKC